MVAATVAGLALLAAGCGTDAGEDATPSSTSTTTAPLFDPASPGPFDTTTTTAPGGGGPATSLPATGLTTCFDERTAIECPVEDAAYAGQDGQVQAGGPLAYTDGGDGTVTDNVTGLMWQAEPTSSTWADADADAAAADTGGYDDWRVPTVTELWSLLDLGDEGDESDEAGGSTRRDGLHLDTDVFGTGEAGPGADPDDGLGARYLTGSGAGSLDGVGTASFFVVDFAAGRVTTIATTPAGTDRPLALRLVRGGDGYGEQDLTGNGDGTITDEATGLTWLQADSGDPAFAGLVAGTTAADGTLDWEEALAFCAELDVAGIDGWRLPNAKELQSLVDGARVATGGAPAVDPLFATTAPATGNGPPDPAVDARAGAYWTSTTAEPTTTADVVRFGRVLGPDDVPPRAGRAPGAIHAVPKVVEDGGRGLLARCVSGGAVSGGAGVSPL